MSTSKISGGRRIIISNDVDVWIIDTDSNIENDPQKVQTVLLFEILKELKNTSKKAERR